MAFLDTKDYSESFKLLKQLLTRSPEFEACRVAIRSIARETGLPEAVAFYHEESSEIVKSMTADIEDGPDPAAVTVDLRTGEAEAIRRSLVHFGLCHIKNACDRDVLERTLISIKNKDHLRFPSILDEETRAGVERLFLFDVREIIEAALNLKMRFDHDASVVRRVDPKDGATFTPFHQDTTAFRKPLVNAWTALTPAGGDYPTMQFVKKRIGVAEQTTMSRPDYALVGLEEEFVLTKYGELLYEPADVEPGDCVLFLGTTIHRSSNLAGAREPRYSLEVRWSHDPA